MQGTQTASPHPPIALVLIESRQRRPVQQAHVEIVVHQQRDRRARLRPRRVQPGAAGTTNRIVRTLPRISVDGAGPGVDLIQPECDLAREHAGSAAQRRDGCGGLRRYRCGIDCQRERAGRAIRTHAVRSPGAAAGRRPASTWRHWAHYRPARSVARSAPAAVAARVRPSARRARSVLHRPRARPPHRGLPAAPMPAAARPAVRRPARVWRASSPAQAACRRHALAPWATGCRDNRRAARPGRS